MHEWKAAYYSATNPGSATKVPFVGIKQHWQGFQPTTKTERTENYWYSGVVVSALISQCFIQCFSKCVHQMRHVNVRLKDLKTKCLFAWVNETCCLKCSSRKAIYNNQSIYKKWFRAKFSAVSSATSFLFIFPTEIKLIYLNFTSCFKNNFTFIWLDSEDFQTGKWEERHIT